MKPNYPGFGHWKETFYPTHFRLCVLGVLLILSNSIFAQDFRRQSRKVQSLPDSLLAPEGDAHARTIRGKVTALSDGEELPLATVMVMGTYLGVQTELNGTFSLVVDVTKPCKLSCQYLGFETQVVELNEKSSYIHFRMKDLFMVKKDVVISASRKAERKMESPVSIEMLSMLDLRNNPSMNLYDRVTYMTGIDVITTSVNFKALNTRGFNTTFNHRFLQRFDNMDLSMPGFNFSAGMLNGPIDLDVERVELIPGSSSALYGPNIINGLINSTSKSPYTYKGLSVNYKLGVNHIDRVDANASPMNDVSLRYANTLKNEKWAYKVTFGYFGATEWKATDYSDNANYTFSDNLTHYGYTKGLGNPGYEAANLLGDEVTNVFDSNNTKFSTVGGDIYLVGNPLKIARTGYMETDLLNYNPYNVKSDLSLHFKPNKNTEISWISRFSKGSSNFQIDNRIQITDFFLTQHKLEVKGKNFVARTYAYTENTGQTVDVSLAAMNINRSAKDDKNWFVQYLLAYSGYYNTLNSFYKLGFDSIEAGNEAAARKFADGNNTALAQKAKAVMTDTTLVALLNGRARFLPGSAEFDSAYEYAKNHSPAQNGALLLSTSKALCAELLYDFKNKIRWCFLMAGLNYRLSAPQTHGTVFNDFTNPLFSNEVGGFVQASKNYYDERLKIQASARLDYMQRFAPTFSPRGSLVYLAGNKRQHSFRLSAQTGYRYPALIDQFSYVPAVGATTIGGFYKDAEQLNLVIKQSDGTDFVNMYVQNSVNKFLATGDSNLLVKPVVRDIQPEKLNAMELGYRTFLFEKLEADINGYFSVYRNLIITRQFIGAANQKDLVSAAYVKDQQNTLIYRQAVNADVPAKAVGLSLSLNYYFNKKINLLGNYNYNQMVENDAFLEQDFIAAFNTPKNKFNIGLMGNGIRKRFGFSSNLRWVDEVDFKEYNKSGIVPAYYSLDLMVSYTLPEQKILFKVGGTNLTNQRYTQSLGAPTIGAVFYFSVLFDELIR